MEAKGRHWTATLGGKMLGAQLGSNSQWRLNLFTGPEAKLGEEARRPCDEKGQEVEPGETCQGATLEGRGREAQSRRELLKPSV